MGFITYIKHEMGYKLKIGVISPNDPREWVRAVNTEMMLKHETLLINVLRVHGYEVVRGGEGLPANEQLAWNTGLVIKHVKNVAKHKPDVLILNQGSWTFPYDSVDAVKLFEKETGDIARVVIFSHKETKVPGLVAGMAVGGALKRLGIPYVLCYGDIEHDGEAINRLFKILEFHEQRVRAAPKVKEVTSQLPYQKYLAFGGMALKMATATTDVDLWQKVFGVSYDNLGQSVLKDRALGMVKWYDKPGTGRFEIIDDRVQEAFNMIHGKGVGKVELGQPEVLNLNKLVYQISLYYAAYDIIAEHNATFAGIKCQDELSANECTACIATAYLNNDVDPAGHDKLIIPTACENDMDSALTQLILYMMSGKPVGFGDFRDISNGTLIIMNCGQHPPYYFGTTDEAPLAKLARVEYMPQEIFYRAGGAAVRGRTPGGELITVARLARENLRYVLVATVVETIEVDPDEHERYNYAWPMIKGKLFIPEDTMIDMWPCNHLAFTYGDYTAHLVEFAHRLDIGFKVFDRNGLEYTKPS